VTDTTLNRVLQKALAGTTNTAAGRCPSDNLMAAYLESHLSSESRSEFERHVSTCNLCSKTLALSIRIAESEVLSGFDPVASVSNRKILFHISVPISLIALLAILVISGVTFYRVMRTSRRSIAPAQTRAQSGKVGPSISAPIPHDAIMESARAIAGDGQPHKQIGDKKFYLRSGFWTDEDCGKHNNAAIAEIGDGSEEYRQIMARFPEVKNLRPVLIYWNNKNCLIK
jgi:hypothetical protein